MKKRTAPTVQQLTENKIETILQVRQFISECFHGLRLNFHPDTPFEDYIDQYGKQTFSTTDQLALEKALEECFEVCQGTNVDLYGICLEEQHNKLKALGKQPRLRKNKP